ncbi:hypothetical protein AWH62_03225 [Maricaulis sp. W15]|uniref:hypothetical protein n=1 Tax=Maricaulis sp. W15 TaxID=1772333 RepID=UPI000948ECFF|nr:hypothetical protein [Maricaulis sp. W15]OLF77700.1 hypothetical protein AWH62_03225 [Maricaulis sp. W15]
MPEDNILPAAVSPPALEFDAAKFQYLLDDPAVSPEEGEAFLKAIWDIIVLILDFGLRIEFEGICPQGDESRSKELDAALADMLSSKDAVLIDKNETEPAANSRSVRGSFDESR